MRRFCIECGECHYKRYYGHAELTHLKPSIGGYALFHNGKPLKERVPFVCPQCGNEEFRKNNVYEVPQLDWVLLIMEESDAA